jgi:hypothetical protein
VEDDKPEQRFSGMRSRTPPAGMRAAERCGTLEPSTSAQHRI